MLKHRLPSGLLLGAVLLASIFVEGAVGRNVFLAATIFLACAAVREYLGMLKAMEMESYPLPTAALAAFLLVSLLLKAPPVAFAAAVAAAVVVSWLSLLNPDTRRDSVRKMVNSLSALPLLIFPLSFLVLIYNENSQGVSGRLLLFFMILVTKCGDIGAYSFGTASAKLMPNGNHKIIPKISPKKSWEGTIGGLATSVAASFAFCRLVPETVQNGDSEIWFPLIAGTLLFVGGFLGDLAESALKRAAGVKDSGNSIPGMGGVLDVLDSLLLNAPLFYLIIIS